VPQSNLHRTADRSLHCQEDRCGHGCYQIYQSR